MSSDDHSHRPVPELHGWSVKRAGGHVRSTEWVRGSWGDPWLRNGVAEGRWDCITSRAADAFRQGSLDCRMFQADATRAAFGSRHVQHLCLQASSESHWLCLGWLLQRALTAQRKFRSPDRGSFKTLPENGRPGLGFGQTFVFLDGVGIYLGGRGLIWS